jgi:hypothetical protein
VAAGFAPHEHDDVAGGWQARAVHAGKDSGILLFVRLAPTSPVAAAQQQRWHAMRERMGMEP